MATKKTYAEVCNNSNYRTNLVLKVNKGEWIKCEGYESCYILDEDLPNGKYSYYCRHKECNLSQIISIKRDKGLTCNFWGCIVTDYQINFGDTDEVLISRTIDDTENYDVVMVFGETATDAYDDCGFAAMKRVVNDGNGALVHRQFYTDAERKAYLQGCEDQLGWENSVPLETLDTYKHYKAIAAML